MANGDYYPCRCCRCNQTYDAPLGVSDLKALTDKIDALAEQVKVLELRSRPSVYSPFTVLDGHIQTRPAVTVTSGTGYIAVPTIKKRKGGK